MIGIDAAEEQRLDVEVLEDAVQWRIPEAADAILVDLDVFRKLLELVDDGGRPAVLLSKCAPLPGSAPPMPIPLPSRLKTYSVVGGRFCDPPVAQFSQMIGTPVARSAGSRRCSA